MLRSCVSLRTVLVGASGGASQRQGVHSSEHPAPQQPAGMLLCASLVENNRSRMLDSRCCMLCAYRRLRLGVVAGGGQCVPEHGRSQHRQQLVGRAVMAHLHKRSGCCDSATGLGFCARASNHQMVLCHAWLCAAACAVPDVPGQVQGLSRLKGTGSSG